MFRTMINKQLFARLFALGGLVAVGVTAALPSQAQLRLPFFGGGGEVTPYELSAAEAADVQAMEDVFNGFRTVDAEFVQTSKNELSQGRILLSRPDGLRMEYLEPAPHILIGNGNAIMYHDRHLEQTTFLPVSRTPAAFIMRDNLDMSDGVVIVGFERRGSFRRVTLVQEDSPDEGAITLVFETNPLRFVGWKIIDPAGEEVNISLVGPRFGVPLDDEIFRIIDPKVDVLPPLPPR